MNHCLIFFLVSFSYISNQTAESSFSNLPPSGLKVMPEMLTALKRTNDPWFSEDKFYHFTASAALSNISYYIYNNYSDGDRSKAKIYSLSATACLGICKEIYDKKKKNHFSWKDLFWDGIGLALGYFLFTD